MSLPADQSGRPADPGEGDAATSDSQSGWDAKADPRVDDAVSRLAEAEALPLAEQVDVYSDIHRRLAAVLADPDSRA